MLPTRLVAGLCTWENAGILSRLYVIALSMAQITNTNRTACRTCSKFVFQALNLHNGCSKLCRRVLERQVKVRRQNNSTTCADHLSLTCFLARPTDCCHTCRIWLQRSNGCGHHLPRRPTLGSKVKRRAIAWSRPCHPRHSESDGVKNSPNDLVLRIRSNPVSLQDWQAGASSRSCAAVRCVTLHEAW